MSSALPKVLLGDILRAKHRQIRKSNSKIYWTSARLSACSQQAVWHWIQARISPSFPNASYLGFLLLGTQNMASSTGDLSATSLSCAYRTRWRAKRQNLEKSQRTYRICQLWQAGLVGERSAVPGVVHQHTGKEHWSQIVPVKHVHGQGGCACPPLVQVLGSVLWSKPGPSDETPRILKQTSESALKDLLKTS